MWTVDCSVPIFAILHTHFLSSERWKWNAKGVNVTLESAKSKPFFLSTHNFSFPHNINYIS
jgi:hypothetical protein